MGGQVRYTTIWRSVSSDSCLGETTWTLATRGCTCEPGKDLKFFGPARPTNSLDRSGTSGLVIRKTRMLTWLTAAASTQPLGVFVIMEWNFKTISYRGGIVTFRIPSHWREEYEPNGGGTFYDDNPDSATLRLNVITAKAPMPITTQSAPDILAGLVQTSAAAE